MKNFNSIFLFASAFLLISDAGYCDTQIKLPPTELIGKINGLRTENMDVKVFIVDGFDDKDLYKDEETSYIASEGGVVGVVGDVSNTKLLADFVSKLKESKIGNVNLEEIKPIISNGLRKYHFSLKIDIEPIISMTDVGVSRKPRMQVTYEYLYETCSVVGETARGLIPYFDCESYVYGVLDTYLRVKNSIPKAQRICFPENIPPWRVLEISYKFNNKYQSADIAAPLILEALHKKFPCSK